MTLSSAEAGVMPEAGGVTAAGLAGAAGVAVEAVVCGAAGAAGVGAAAAGGVEARGGTMVPGFGGEAIAPVYRGGGGGVAAAACLATVELVAFEDFDFVAVAVAVEPDDSCSACGAAFDLADRVLGAAVDFSSLLLLVDFLVVLFLDVFDVI